MVHAELFMKTLKFSIILTIKILAILTKKVKYFAQDEVRPQF